MTVTDASKFDDMTIVSLTVDSFQKIRAAHVEPSPTGVVAVRGKNRAGKSSLIGSMMAVLLGRKFRPTLPITAGERGSKALLDLGRIEIIGAWKRDSAGAAKFSLAIKSKEGYKFGTPAALLDELVSNCADPGAFIEMTPAEQGREVLAALGLSDELTRMEDEVSAAFERRKEIARDERSARAEYESLRARTSQLPRVEAVAPIEELTVQLREANEANSKLERNRLELTSIEREGHRLASELKELEARMAQVKAAIESKREEYSALASEVASSKLVDTANLERLIQIASAQAKNQSICDQFADASNKVGALEAQLSEANETLESCRLDVRKLFESVDFPIEGMRYDLESKALLLNDLPLAQASQAEAIQVGCAIAMLGDPKIRVMFIRDGSLLDADSLALIDQICVEHNFQAWVEQVSSDSAGVGIYIEDGEVVQITAGDSILVDSDGEAQ